MAMIRQHVFYSGRVQGVGFRYTVARCARPYAVTGFVRNLHDGRVELVVEGSDADVAGLLDDVRRAMEGYIHAVDDDRLTPTGEFPDFSIRM